MRAALLLALAACASNAIVVEPVVDVPADAPPFGIDTIEVSIAHDGSAIDLFFRSFSHGQTVELPGVSFGDDLVIHMTGLKTTGPMSAQEEAYGRTCAFQVSPTGAPHTPHLWFPQNAMFARVPQPFELRAGGAALPYHDGSTLFVGGIDDTGAAVSDIERFDPLEETLGVVAPLLHPVVGAAVAPFGAGAQQLAVIGGVDPTGQGLQLFQLIDASSTGSNVITIPAMGMDRTELTATGLTDGRIIVMGGVTVSSHKTVGNVDQIYFDMTKKTVATQPADGTLKFPRHLHTVTPLAAEDAASLLVVGGLDDTGQPIAAAELFKPLSNTFSTSFARQMVVPRSGHQALRLQDGSVVIIGGVDASHTPVSVIERFTFDGGFAKVMDAPPANAGLVDFAATTMHDGRILVTGGRPLSGEPVATAYLIDLVNDTVTVLPTSPMTVPRARHQATLLCDGTVLISGGTTTAMPAERYNPGSRGRR